MSDRSAQVTVTTAGTAVQGPALRGNAFQINFKDGQAGLGYVGNVSGDVTSSNGYELKPGGSPVIASDLSNLNQLYFDSTEDSVTFTCFKIR